MTEEALGRVRELIEVLRDEGARRSPPGPFFEAAKTLEDWLAVPGRNRAKPREVVAAFMAWAKLATREAKANRDDERREGMRRARWYCVFLVAEAFELDPFGERAEEAEEQGRRRGGDLLASYDGPRCAGVRKNGRPCRGIPPRGAAYCYQHQDQAREPAAAEPVAVGEELDPEAAFDAAVDRWLAEAEHRPGQ